jgi:hypothetical protein
MGLLGSVFTNDLTTGMAGNPLVFIINFYYRFTVLQLYPFANIDVWDTVVVAIIAQPDMAVLLYLGPFIILYFKGPLR